MFGTWYQTDYDCYQHIRKDGDTYEIIQCLWLDMTEYDRKHGGCEYVIVNTAINLNDYSDEEKENYISSYGYDMNSVVEQYGDAATSIIAECILEEECMRDGCIIDTADSFEEAQEKIEKHMKEA